ncbi:MAG: tRNA (N(6)-L-threonylcarbamoyladenosine(37)-C(2))-methylthiotransferase MtaB [Paludibacteraceae bacterium]|nr:tRNA (N(6)-L-threonylcarbamoyladenosine(37)-C(2))-methylthiotransferase MtaB [Paludibacteraceae bacterium]
MTPAAYQFHTLGCKLNFSESSYLASQLRELGMHPAQAGESPQLCIVNTCTVTDAADTKGRQLIHRLHREHPDAKIIVMGCYAQLKPAEIAGFEGVSLVLGSNDKFDLPALLEEIGLDVQVRVSDTKTMTPFKASCSKEDRTRHFLKIQDGCDCFCTYCAIPFARGRSRSGSIASLVNEAQWVAAQGGKEIILTGVNIGDFGRHQGETLLELVEALAKVPGIERYRISSIEPDLLSDELIDFVAENPKFAPHFHIPLQAGSDEVLRLMHRRYDTSLFADKIARIRQRLPQAFVGVDVMAGMRGETEALFDQSYHFIEALPVCQLHVFPYSERAGTAALRIEHCVTPKEKRLRTDLLLALSDKKKQDFYQSQVGQSHQVLWESARKKGTMAGFTENYVRVRCAYDAARTNTLETIVLTEDLLSYEI